MKQQVKLTRYTRVVVRRPHNEEADTRTDVCNQVGIRICEIERLLADRIVCVFRVGYGEAFGPQAVHITVVVDVVNSCNVKITTL